MSLSRLSISQSHSTNLHTNGHLKYLQFMISNFVQDSTLICDWCPRLGSCTKWSVL